MSADKDARIAELEAKLENMGKLATPAYMVTSENKVMLFMIASLERKLAEQQALYRKLVLLFNQESKEEFMEEKGFEELNNLLAKAKEEGRKEFIPAATIKCEIVGDAEYHDVLSWELPAGTYELYMLASAPKQQGEIKCASCGELTPVEEEGLDHICNDCCSPKPQGEIE